MVAITGCGSYTFTSAGGKATIQVDDVEDGETGESMVITVGKGRKIVVESALEKGELKIDFAEAIELNDDPDDTENYITGDVVATVSVGADGKEEISLDPGQYFLQVTSVGNTSGTVKINAVKEE